MMSGENNSTAKQDPAGLQIYDHFYVTHLMRRSTSSSDSASLADVGHPRNSPSFTRLTAGAARPCNDVMSYHHRGTFAYNNPSHTFMLQGGRHYFF